MTLFRNFYSTTRAGAFRLSDGGGPFGFDITVACQFDVLVQSADVDGIIETGCFVGDTLEYLGKQYPERDVIGVEIDERSAAIARRRCELLPNVTVVTGDSAQLLGDISLRFRSPLVYLDAHWDDQWPLERELKSLSSGIVAVDDFDIRNPRFGFDTYGGIALDRELLHRLRPDLLWMEGNPEACYPYPCLQVGRRTGTAYAIVGGLPQGCLQHDFFRTVPALEKRSV